MNGMPIMADQPGAPLWRPASGIGSQKQERVAR